MLKVLEPVDWYVVYERTWNEAGDDLYIPLVIVKSFSKLMALDSYRMHLRQNLRKFEPLKLPLNTRAKKISLVEKERLCGDLEAITRMVVKGY